jgi:hypothetical protein
LELSLSKRIFKGYPRDVSEDVLESIPGDSNLRFNTVETVAFKIEHSCTQTNILIFLCTICTFTKMKCFTQPTRENSPITRKYTQITQQENTLRKLSNEISINVNALTNLGVQANHWDYVIINATVPKLPSEVQKAWFKRIAAESTYTLADFKKFIEEQASVAESVKYGNGV